MATRFVPCCDAETMMQLWESGLLVSSAGDHFDPVVLNPERRRRYVNLWHGAGKDIVPRYGYIEED